MECGANEYACLVFDWLKDNELAALAIAKMLGLAGGENAGFFGKIVTLVKENSQTIFGLAGGSFGIWRWWRYREQILHKRLSEYLLDSNRHLITAQDEALKSLQRPGPGQLPLMPLFAEDEMRSVLRERRWHVGPLWASIESNANLQLQKAAEKTQRQLNSGEAKIGALRQQLATAHILRGAIASSSAENATDSAIATNIAALTSFRTALQVPGHDRNVIAKELEAHQLRKLGKLAEAQAAYRQLENLAPTLVDIRSHQLILARAKRYQAEILQAQASTLLPDKNRLFKGSNSAADLLYKNRPESALKIRSQIGPFQCEDLLEQAELHYLTAFVARNLGDVRIENDQLTEAETSYGQLNAQTSTRRLWWSTDAGTEKLREKAEAGLKRVKKAKAAETKTADDYDWQWLIPESKQP